MKTWCFLGQCQTHVTLFASNTVSWINMWSSRQIGEVCVCTCALAIFLGSFIFVPKQSKTWTRRLFPKARLSQHLGKSLLSHWYLSAFISLCCFVHSSNNILLVTLLFLCMLCHTLWLVSCGPVKSDCRHAQWIGCSRRFDPVSCLLSGLCTFYCVSAVFMLLRSAAEQSCCKWPGWK